MEEKQKQTRRSGLKIMLQMVGLIKPLLHIMVGAVILGIAGYLCAIFLTILAGHVLLGDAPVKMIFTAMAVMAVMRGVLHYIEQYCNHYIAFKLLAIIRHKVFAALRKLCPAKLEGRDKGNLISIITTDIELLEVFYAHTISPILIAIGVSAVMVIYIGHYHVAAGIFALTAYVIVGCIIPLWNGKRGAADGMTFRNEFGEMNSFVLDSLRGLDETIQYGHGDRRKAQMNERSENLSKLQKQLSGLEGSQKSVTTLTILAASLGMLYLTWNLFESGAVDFEGVLIPTIAMMGSFGPVTALSSLSNNLSQTLASGERVLAILEEKPLVEEIPEDPHILWDGVTDFEGAKLCDVTFSYEEEVILRDYSMDIQPGRILGIHGASGSGKSTLLKLLMRFWDVNTGEIRLSGKNVKEIPTKRLRDSEAYVTQETHLFHDTIANNIAVAKMNATREEIIEAAKKASIHDFITTLPKGYDTEVGELGDTLSGGEKQRIGIARAFLHDAPLMLFDESTANLDALNEGIILKALKEECIGKTIVLVSHRKSTMSIADTVFEMKQGRIS